MTINEVRNKIRGIILNESLPPEKMITIGDMELACLLFKAFECKTEEEVGSIFREKVYGDPNYKNPLSNVPPGAYM